MKDYSVGLDIGTGSVGFVAMDQQYRLMRAKGKNIIGVRLFEPSKTAEKRRRFRTTRRRLSRRRWRLSLLNDCFAPELQNQGDPNFLHRLKYSWVHPKDTLNQQNYSAAPLFNDSGQDKAFYNKYPTIYHLRRALMNDTKQHDLREVYLAIHHIVKYRGNFLLGDGQIDQEAIFDIHSFLEAMQDFCQPILSDESTLIDVDEARLVTILFDKQLSRAKRVTEGVKVFDGQKNKALKTVIKLSLTGIVGNQFNLATMLQKEGLNPKDSKWKIKFTESDLEAKLETINSGTILSDSEKEFLTAIQKAYNGLTLKLLLDDAHSWSEAMIKLYEAHKGDWKLIKKELRTSENKAEVNQAYLNLQADNDDVRRKANKYFTGLIKKSTTLTKEKQNELLSKIENEIFLPVQRSKANVSIPHQLHLNELIKIIENQKQYYPFLAEVDKKGRNKLQQLLKFRVPYYVGPLVEPKTVDGDSSNHWMTRLEAGPITPWNIEEKVDTDQAGLDFIKRMTGTDTYLIGEPALPKNALIYQSYNVLQELNNVRINVNQRLEVAQKQEIYENIFKGQKSVSVIDIKDYIKTKYGKDVNVSGLSDTKGGHFNSKLTTYHYFLNIFDRAYVEDHDNQETLETIIELQTIFEDRKILKRQLSKLSVLTKDQVESLSKQHLTGWGRLSKKLLTTKFVQLSTKAGTDKKSILETLYETKMNLMEIISDSRDRYGARAWLEEENAIEDKETSLKSVINELAGPKNIKRGILQSFYILDEITRVLGRPPKNVYLEVARNTQASELTNSRLAYLKTVYGNKSLSAEFKALSTQLNSVEDAKMNAALRDDRLYLYYLQQGKDMYTGEPINIDLISSNYQIDHIIPRAYGIDCLDNRVLVKSELNARKADSPTYLPELICSRCNWWRSLKTAGLLSEQKFKNLTRKSDDFSDLQKERFIARSLVETRQITRNVATLIGEHFNDETKVRAIRSEITTDMRHYLAIYKNRDLNDYHHAFDALLFTTAGLFMDNIGFFKKGQLSDYAGHIYNRYTKQALAQARANAKDKHQQRIRPLGFVVGSMASSNKQFQVNQATGELVWTMADEAYLRKVMDYKKILVTKMVYDQTGELYKQTRIPRDGKEYGKRKIYGKVAFDKRKDLALYGGFDSLQTAYTALVFSKKKFKLVNVQRLWLSEIKADANYLTKMVQQSLNDPKAKIILDHIPYEQLLIKDQAKVTIASENELHNFQQLYLSKTDSKDLLILLNARSEEMAEARLKQYSHSQDAKQRFTELLTHIIEQALKYYKLQTHQTALLKLQDKVIEFTTLEFEKQQEVVQRVLQALHANAIRSNLEILGLSESWGRLNAMVNLSPSDKFVYTSYTGLYTSTVSVQELADQAKLE